MLLLQQSDALGRPGPASAAHRSPGLWLAISMIVLLLAIGRDLATGSSTILGPAIRLQLPFGDTVSILFSGRRPTEAVTRITPDRARAINAAMPFDSGPVHPARPLQLAVSGESHSRARDCLAAAAWYEAGQDTVGQRSVIQVVLNRVMHPAFPKTVCGVVYEGSYRSTGCQFTFTCDGSMRSRRPSAEAWQRARANAEAALGGFVDPTVGLATHYHTDWVAPRWSASMAKIARVGTHLFFRFRGSPGQPRAYRDPPGEGEPQIAAMAMLSPAHGSMPVPPLAIEGSVAERPPVIAEGALSSSRTLQGNRVAAADAVGSRFALELNMGGAWGRLANVARRLCGGGGRCTVMGWAPALAPGDMAGFQARRGSALFVYRRSADGAEIALWDCRTFPRPEGQCMSGTAPLGREAPAPALAQAEASPASRVLAVRETPPEHKATP